MSEHDDPNLPTDAECEALADEAERGYDVSKMRVHLVRVQMECLVCEGKMIGKGTRGHVNQLVSLWEQQHEPCRQTASERVASE